MTVTVENRVEFYRKLVNSLTVKLATKRVCEEQREDWKRQMQVAQWRIEALVQFDPDEALVGV